MWDCGPYADLYEPLDYDYEDIDEGLRQPMEFAHNNVRAFLYDVEMGFQTSGVSKFDFSKPRGGRFRFELKLKYWRVPDAPEIAMSLWMPYDRLCQVREMPATNGARKTLLLDGESLYWEDAVSVISKKVRERRGGTSIN